MPFEVLRRRKFFGKIPLITAQICGIGIATLALGFLSFRYYEQQSALVKIYESEALGASLATDLMKQLIEVSLTDSLSSEARQRIHQAIENTYKSEFIRAAKFENTLQLDSSSQVLAETLTQLLSIVTEQSNLILDANFETYYLSDAFFRWLPEILFQQRTLISDLENNKDMDIRNFCLEQFIESLKRTGLGSSSKEIFSFNYLTAFYHSSQSLLTSRVSGQIPKPRILSLKKSVATLLEAGSQQFHLQNQARIDSKRAVAVWSFSFSIFLWLCSVILVIISWKKLTSGDKSFLKIIHDQESALEKSRKLAALGELAGSISHDIANPLSIIEGSAYLLERELDQHSPILNEQIAKIRRMVFRIHGITSSLKSFLVQDASIQASAVDLCVVLEDLQLLLKSRLNNSGTEFILDLAEADLFVYGSESAYVQILVNIVNNALDAVKSSSRKQITISAEKRDQFLCIQIHDTGPGVPNHLREQIFESFFTTKASEGGTGLGLSISRKLIRGFGGDISYLPNSAGGCFELKIPSLRAKQIEIPQQPSSVLEGPFQ